MATLEALIFDVDGTLADTEAGHLAAFNHAFADAGLDWEWSTGDYTRLLEVTGGKERMAHYLKAWEPATRPPEPVNESIAALHAAKTRHYVAMLEGGAIALRPGVERLLREAREAGLRLAIATTTTPANVEALLEHTLGPGAMDWFEVVGAGGVVPHKKPAPDIYEYVLREMGLAPTAAIAFEDSGPGVRAARGAGLPVIVTTSTFTVDHDFTGAALVLDSMGEVERPFGVLGGDAGGHEWLDVELVREVHRAANFEF
ncbi:MAG: HAD family hydrolase [Gammaproteobacteria bacterium]|nr:HAD family hydrolase [Gammaproteobacteria bacterium]